MMAGPTMKVILPGPVDQATAEVTHLVGDEEHERLGSSLDLAGGRRSVSSQTMTRRLASENSLRRRRLGQGLVIYKDLPPMRLALRPYYRDGRLRALQESHGDEAQGPDDNAAPSPILASLKHRLGSDGLRAACCPPAPAPRSSFARWSRPPRRREGMTMGALAR